ncbi:MAG: glycosyltransferase family 4 protein [bacterium]
MTLRILHVLSSPHLGGAEQMCLRLAEAQLTAGQEVALHVFERGKVTDAAQVAGIPTIRSPGLCEPTSLSRRERWRIFAEQFQNTLEEFQPDLVHSHVPLTHLVCHRVAPRIPVPWVATIHGSWKQFAYAPQTHRRPYLRPYLLLRHAIGDFLVTRSAARIVAVSDSVQRDLERVGIHRRRIVRIHNGLAEVPNLVDKESGRARFRIAADSIVLGSLGFMAPVKGFDLLIRAAGSLTPRYPRLCLLIAGGDVLGQESVRRTLQKLVKKLNLQEHVQLLDALDPAEGFFSALDIYVVSSRTEGTPLSLIEAMQYGKPSVVTSAGGCVEAARPELEGLVFRSGDVRSLAGAIERLIMDGSLRESLGHAARERAAGYLTLSRCAGEYENLYSSVLDCPSPYRSGKPPISRTESRDSKCAAVTSREVRSSDPGDIPARMPLPE